MERIKQALEKARRERESQHTDSASTAQSSVSSPPNLPKERPAPAGTQSAASREDDNRPGGRAITYTQTKTLEFSLDSLLARRVVAVADTPLSAAYKVLRTQVLQRMRLNEWNALAITSPGREEGKTLTAVNLAVALAKEVNQTVLLVDLDLRQPSVHKYFGYEPELGISDYILHGAELPQMLFNPGVERLVVLPGRERIEHSSESISSPKTVRLVEELKSRYPSRIVLFDVPPLLAVDDTLAFAPYVDAVLIVAREGKTRRNELAIAAELVSGTPILGTVLNESDEKVDPFY